VVTNDVRGVALVADSLRGGWFASELAALGMKLRLEWDVGHVVRALVDDPAPHPQILFVDFDPLSALDVLQLHTIRERGWFGVIFAFGSVTDDLRTSLNIERVLPLSTSGAALRETVIKVGLDRPTSRMRPLRRTR
jgi:hypothetical protein